MRNYSPGSCVTIAPIGTKSLSHSATPGLRTNKFPPLSPTIQTTPGGRHRY